MYIYEIKEDGTYEFFAKEQKASGCINAIDWTLDSSDIRTFSGAHETIYFNMKEKKFDAHGGQTAKEKMWASNTMKYGDEEKGMNPAGEDKTHINDIQQSRDGSHIFSADDFGLVNAFHMPNPKCEDSSSYCGHSEHVSRIRLTPDQQRLLSVGGEDKTLIQWRIKGLSVIEKP